MFFFIFFLFLRLSYNSIIYPFPFLPASPPLYFSMYSFKPTASFSFTNGYCLHICLYLSVPRYNLLNLYSVTCVYIFRDYNLVLDNQSVCSFLRETVSPTLSIPCLPVILGVGLQPSNALRAQFWPCTSLCHHIKLQKICLVHRRAEPSFPLPKLAVPIESVQNKL